MYVTDATNKDFIYYFFDSSWGLPFHVQRILHTIVMMATKYWVLMRLPALLCLISLMGVVVISTPSTLELEEKLEYYILMDAGVARGLEFCGPESPPVFDPYFWRLRISMHSNLLGCGGGGGWVGGCVCVCGGKFWGAEEIGMCEGVGVLYRSVEEGM